MLEVGVPGLDVVFVLDQLQVGRQPDRQGSMSQSRPVFRSRGLATVPGSETLIGTKMRFGSTVTSARKKSLRRGEIQTL